MQTWDDLNFWSTGEWQVIQERLDDLDRNHQVYNPKRSDLFAALDTCPYSGVKCVLIGQDPYPEHDNATGLAFSIPKSQKKIPPTLQNILKELANDMGWEDKNGKLMVPEHGDLTSWAEQGVLLWNAIPTCAAGNAGSHGNWVEWELLTQEIVEACSDKGVVFGFLGLKAYKYRRYIDEADNDIVFANHPSPLAANQHNAKHPFLGSRFFSTINGHLVKRNLGAIDWRL